MTTVLCPGSFDPPTVGHVDMISRCSKTFDSVLVGVVANPSKAPLFSAEERVDMLEELFVDDRTVQVASFSGLLVDFSSLHGVDLIVKGIRSATDLEYELQMAQMNEHLTGVDTWFMPTRAEFAYVSSSLVKEVAKLGGAGVADLVPPTVWTRLTERLDL